MNERISVFGISVLPVLLFVDVIEKKSKSLKILGNKSETDNWPIVAVMPILQSVRSGQALVVQKTPVGLEQ